MREQTEKDSYEYQKNHGFKPGERGFNPDFHPDFNKLADQSKEEPETLH